MRQRQASVVHFDADDRHDHPDREERRQASERAPDREVPDRKRLERDGAGGADGEEHRRRGERRPPRSGGAGRSAERLRRARLRRLEGAIRWRRSTSVGTTGAGALVGGVRLPAEGVHFFTPDPVRWTLPNRSDRRWGSARLLRTILRVARAYAAAHPDAPRIAIGDVGREAGGPFDARYGIVGEFGPGRGTLGHVSHQNGLDVDVYYLRRDGRERGPRSLDQVDRRLSQDLVDRFVAAGAQLVFVGPRMGLTGTPGVVQVAARHDDHLHVRLPPAP